MSLWSKQTTWTDLVPVTRKRKSRFTVPGGHLATLVAGAGIGAGVMYYADPDRGRRRRKTTVDRSVAALRRAGRQVMSNERRSAARLSGSIIRLRHVFDEPGEVANDEMLTDRILSQAFRDFDFPHGQVNLNVENRVAVLRGVLGQPDQINRLEKAVQNVPGVWRVES